MLNSFIHILMYSYYGLSTIPSMQRYLWWKRYLTQAQLVSTQTHSPTTLCWCTFASVMFCSCSVTQVQFVLTITHTVSAWVVPCGFPLGCLKFQTFYMVTLVILFVNFYLQVRNANFHFTDWHFTDAVPLHTTFLFETAPVAPLLKHCVLAVQRAWNCAQGTYTLIKSILWISRWMNASAKCIKENVISNTLENHLEYIIYMSFGWTEIVFLHNTVHRLILHMQFKAFKPPPQFNPQFSAFLCLIP